MRWLVLTFLFLSSVCGIGQSPTEQIPATDKGAATRAAEKKKDKESQSSLGCYAKKDAPNIFWGFWNPKPTKEAVSVEVMLGNPPAGLAGLDCVGEPLELTVPNGQKVILTTSYDNLCSSTSTTVSVTRPSSDSPVPDILALIAKGGPIALYEGAAANVYELSPQKNKILSIDATCKIGTDRKSTQNVKITYQTPPRVAVSAGFLLATTGIQSYGIKTVQTGVGTGGVVNTQNSIGVSVSVEWVLCASPRDGC
jgi:hypothetical protein